MHQYDLRKTAESRRYPCRTRYVMNTKAKETHNTDAASKRVIAENDSDQNDEDLNKNFMDIIANQT